MATITVPLVLIEVAGPVLLALVVGASLAALTWQPRRGESDPIRTVAVIEIVLVSCGVAVWQGITGNLGLAAVAFVVALLGLISAARMIIAAQEAEPDDARERDLDVSLTEPSNDPRGRIQAETPVQAYASEAPQHIPVGGASSARLAGLALSRSVETTSLEG